MKGPITVDVRQFPIESFTRLASVYIDMRRLFERARTGLGKERFASPLPDSQYKMQSSPSLFAIGVSTLGFPAPLLSLTSDAEGLPALIYIALALCVVAVAHLRARDSTEATLVSSRLFDNLQEPVFTTNLQDRLVDLNPAALRMFNVRREVCLGKPIDSILSGFSATASTAAADGASISLDLSLPDGHSRQFHVSISALYDGERLSGYTYLLHDVTSLAAELDAKQQAAAAALEASRLSSEFLAVVSHEIRTPMQAVIGMTGLLLGTELTDEQRDYVETIHSSGDSMLSIVNNVLDFSKIEAGQIELERKPFEPVAAVEDTLAIFAGQAAMKQVELAFVLGGDVPSTVLGDVTRFRQVLSNLVGNAVKFTDRGEVTVRINSQQQNEQILLHIRVRDTGIGIPADRMGRLFHNFSQADASTARIYGGTGLGLAICKSLCEIMGGDVWVESHSGVGSTFNFTVIVEPHESEELAVTKDLALKGRSALVIDDNPASREMLSTSLGAWGMQVETVESGWTAMQTLEKNSAFDVILIDMHMPVMDGEAVARRIRSMRYRPEPKLVMMLALTDSGTRTRAAEIGLASVIVKPLKRAQLRGVLGNLFAANKSDDSKAGDVQTLPPPKRNYKTSVLLADDNRVGQRVTSALLRRLGYKADVVASGKEVLEAMEQQPYDIVLMDVYMPDLDGLVTTRKIRAEYADDQQPYVIALTASAVSSDRQECLNAGMDDYLSKPISIKELEEALQRAGSSDESDL